MPDRLDYAQICMNGHLITHYYEKELSLHQNYCEKCGEPTIKACPNCEMKIGGGGIKNTWAYETTADYSQHFPYYCKHCGKPYPWTDRKLQALREFIEETKITKKEKELLLNSINDLVVDTPNTIVAAVRWKKILSSAGSELLKVSEQILSGIVTETVRIAIFGV